MSSLLCPYSGRGKMNEDWDDKSWKLKDRIFIDEEEKSIERYPKPG
jgi:hypothetical protein